MTVSGTGARPNGDATLRPAPAPSAPPLDKRMRRYMLARQARKRIADGLSALVRIAYPGRLDRARHAVIIPESSLSPWRFDTSFRETFERIAKFTLVDEMRLYELWSLTEQLATTPGDILEVGVWRGGSGCLIASRSRHTGSDATVFLCDTFSGVVKAGADDPLYSGGEHDDTSPNLVRGLARHLGLDNVEVLVGIFPDDTAAAVENRRFKLCHLDVDVHDGPSPPRPGCGPGSSTAASSWSTTTAATAWTVSSGPSTSSPTTSRVAPSSTSTATRPGQGHGDGAGTRPCPHGSIRWAAVRHW